MEVKRCGADAYVDLEGAKRMLNYFDQWLYAVDRLVAGDPWPRTVTITVNTTALCDFRACLLKLIDRLDFEEAECYIMKKE